MKFPFVNRSVCPASREPRQGGLERSFHGAPDIGSRTKFHQDRGKFRSQGRLWDPSVNAGAERARRLLRPAFSTREATTTLTGIAVSACKSRIPTGWHGLGVRPNCWLNAGFSSASSRLIDINAREIVPEWSNLKPLQTRRSAISLWKIVYADFPRFGRSSRTRRILRSLRCIKQKISAVLISLVRRKLSCSFSSCKITARPTLRCSTGPFFFFKRDLDEIAGACRSGALARSRFKENVSSLYHGYFCYRVFRGLTYANVMYTGRDVC